MLYSWLPSMRIKTHHLDECAILIDERVKYIITVVYSAAAHSIIFTRVQNDTLWRSSV